MIYLTPLSLIPALFVWRTPDLSTFGALIGLGGLGTIAHLSIARALAAADASASAPFEFFRLPFAALIGFLWFGETTDAWTWAGAAIIAGSSVYVAHREGQLSRLNRAALAARTAAQHPKDASAPALEPVARESVSPALSRRE
jgi:drug/metabolite transporter (DMT)-like permease